MERHPIWAAIFSILTGLLFIIIGGKVAIPLFDALLKNQITINWLDGMTYSYMGTTIFYGAVAYISFTAHQGLQKIVVEHFSWKKKEQKLDQKEKVEIQK